MPDIYSIAWKILAERIVSTRKQSISKHDLLGWQLKALEEAVDRIHLEAVYKGMPHGQQKEA